MEISREKHQVSVANAQIHWFIINPHERWSAATCGFKSLFKKKLISGGETTDINDDAFKCPYISLDNLDLLKMMFISCYFQVNLSKSTKF